MSLPRAIRPEAMYFHLMASVGAPQPVWRPPTESLVCTVEQRGDWFVARSTQMSVNRSSAVGAIEAARLLGRLYFFGKAVGVPPEAMARLKVEVLVTGEKLWALRVTLEAAA